ncbi:hypothetical protein PybrP1_002215 [[Pythium] brassicae (nom. inval.)]|nr:hypothetical protein PybrP1_002215 [[Pythium] brassicae (nom. inval.)]
MSDASDELSRSFDFDDRDDDAAFAQQVLAAVRGASAQAPATGGDDATDAAHEHGAQDASANAPRASAARLLEALEALSQDTDGDGLPHVCVVQMMSGLFPFAQLLSEAPGQSRFQRTLEAISPQAPTHVQVSGLSELLETLSLSSEEVLVMSGFNVDKFVPPVVALIRFSPTMDVLLLAARALAAILEHFPATAVPKAVAEGVVPSLCEKLLEIEYMDVAELALQILERLVCKPEALASPAAVAEYRHRVVQENGFVALLQFVDFFPIDIQRTAARIVCQLCTDFPAALAAELRGGFALLANLLHAFDAEILQSACDAMRKLAESKSFSASPALAALVASDDVCDAMAKLLAAYGGDAQPQLASPGYTSILKFMACVLSSSSAVSSSALAARLRFERLPPIVAALLASEAATEDKQLLRDTLKLVIVLLPVADELAGFGARVPVPVLALAHESLPSIVRVYDATTRSDLRYECLGVIYRACAIVYATAGAAFSAREHAELSRLAGFLARVLRPTSAGRSSASGSSSSSSAGGDERDLLPVHLALQIVESSLDRATSARAAVLALFERHGVATAIRYYAARSGDSATQDDTYEVLAASTRLVDEYLGRTSANTSLVVQLQSVVAELERVLADSSDSKRDSDMHDVLQKLQRVVLRGDDPVTAHEIACSGLVPTLSRVLSRTDGKRAFERVFLDEDDTRGPSRDAFVPRLVQCVQDAIASEKDAFSTEYLGAHGGGSSVSNDLEQLTQHVKVRVLIDDDGRDESAAADASSSSSSAVAAQQPATADDEPRRSGNWFKKHGLRRSGSGSATARLDPGHAYRRNRKSVHDTVVLVEPLARIETMEEFISDKLFGARGSVSILDELTGRSLADDDESEQKDDGDGDGDAVKEKKVQALLKGIKLPADMSILEAIVKFGAGGAHDVAPSRIWSSTPHEIAFRVLSPTPPSDEKSAPASGSASDSGDEADAERSDTLAATLEVGAPPPAAAGRAHQWWDDVWDLLSLLKLVHELVGSHRLQSSGATPAHSAVVFTNSFLSLQVNRVLQQPVRVVTHALPAWCFRLLTDFAFVLDYDTRYHFTYAISCGSSRAIQYLCRSVWKRAVQDEPVVASRAAAGAPSSSSSSASRRRTATVSGGARSRTAALVNISRMVKLPRLKVRVARSRLLQSAMKLLAIYGGKKAVIEIEFLGEVGTGLGPTTEFFTLICQEIQAKHLRMWRDDDDDRSSSQQPTTPTTTPRVSDAGTDDAEEKSAQAALPIRGYHRVAVYHCASCSRVRFPHCTVHNQLLTHETRRDSNQQSRDSNQQSRDSSVAGGDRGDATVSAVVVPQCAECLDARDWHSEMAACDCSTDTAAAADGDTEATAATRAPPALTWWILSDEEAQYLSKVYPRRAASVRHPVLQCTHCDTVNFPGTDAGIVTMDGERMLSRSGRRMYERDYRAVTKHVSPLCEGTPLSTLPALLARADVELLVALTARSPEVLECEVEALRYLHETSQFSDGGPAVRLLNLPFSRPFLRAVRGEPLAPGDAVSVDTALGFVAEFDPAIGASLRFLHALAQRGDAAATANDTATTAALRADVEALCLSFTLVGDSGIELCAGGATQDVTLATLREYVRLNLVFLLDTTVARQVAAFQRGFAQICGARPHEKHFLRVFDVSELEQMLGDAGGGGGGSMWDRDGHELREHTVCDHGYTAESRAIADLIAVLCELPVAEQRLFLEPKLTVVRKLAETSDSADEPVTGGGSSSGFTGADAVLPSASTCTNYLKLPEYSTREARGDDTGGGQSETENAADVLPAHRL